MVRPFEMTIEAQLTVLRCANDEEGWGIAEGDFTRLASSAPAWPKRAHVYRSFRIRFGEGDEGVAKTFEAHYKRIQHVFGEDRCWRFEDLYSSPTPYDGELLERLRLLNGNKTHKACVDWIVADLDAHKTRKSIKAVRDSRSLADELLVIAWMFPDMIRAIDYDYLPGLFAAGYEIDIPECGPEEEVWDGAILVGFGRVGSKVEVNVSRLRDDDFGYSVPVLRE